MLKNIIRQLRETHHLTQEEVSKYLNVQRTTYTRYETGTNSLSFETLCKLADLYNVSTDFLLERNPQNIVNIDPEVVSLYNSSAQIFKDITVNILKKGKEYNRDMNQIQKQKCVPLIGQEIVGIPIVMIENAFSKDAGILQNEKVNIGDFVVIAKDDSMINAGINIGDYVVIRPQSGINNGEIALLGFDDHALLRTVYEHKGFIELVPANNNYTTEYYKNTDNIYIIGKSIKIIEK